MQLSNPSKDGRSKTQQQDRKGTELRDAETSMDGRMTIGE